MIKQNFKINNIKHSDLTETWLKKITKKLWINVAEDFNDSMLGKELLKNDDEIEI